ncbi:MAG TPA: universal stress protein [Stellaceae bacterium]|jgi:nucleotide-binding universal stress UspA family protein|nr:universal stress protein [Stellaceae bacterium]
MIKTILVPATGNQTDDAVFTSALAAARAFNAHLDFLHIRVDAAAMVAAMATDGSGAAMVSGLVERVDEEATRREATARQMFDRFCERERAAIEDAPAGQQSPTAQWLRQTGDEAYWVREYGRAADLLVVGHPAEDQGVSIDTIEAALVGTGRPVLIVPAAPLVSLPETIVIAWKAAPEAARAVTAAMPLLSKAKQILIVTVAEEQGLSDEEGARLMTALGWHGLNASTRHLRPDRLGAADTLLAAAAEEGALVVMGAYGHSRFREWIFGGFTEHVLRGAAVPVLMMH